MDEKSKTIPRSKREKSPTPSVSSLVSIRSLASGKLKKIPLVSRRKKKRKSADLLEVPTNVSPGGQYVERETDVSEVEVTSAEENNSSSPPVRSLSSPSMSRREVNFATMDSPPTGKSPKPKKRFKNLIKGGKNLFKNKNESTPILVDAVAEVRRGLARNREETGAAETANGVVIPEVIEEVADVELESESLKESSKAVSDDEETADYDWSISSTCARVKKMSIAEIRESVYVEVPDDEDEDDDDDVLDQTDVRSLPSRTVTPEVTEDEMSARKFNFISASVPATPDPLSDPNDPTVLTFNRKSPSTLKKEILQITKHRKVSEQYGNGALVKNRKASLQARNPTDKNELLFKILVIGEISTGKTSIIKRYVHQFFSQHYRATIGVDFALKVLSWDNNTTIRLQLWDIAGQERFGSMTRVYYKEAVGAFIVFDVTRAGTFDAVVKWKQDLDSKIQLPDGGPIPCVLLANKCDQPKEVIVSNQSKMDEFCKEHRFIAWFETSAKDNINIDEAAHCLVTKIVQNDQERQDEKEYSNGIRMTENRSISLDNLDASTEKKNCAC